LSFSDLVARELYFATGVFEERTKGDDAKVPTPSQRKRFFEEAKQLLEMVAELGIPSATHHLLEMLEHYIEHSPREAFLLIVRTLRAGKWGGYQYESVGQDLFVRFVERYLAEHRSLFQDDQECQSGMLAVLDIFVNAGWPSAQRLSYRLDEIFR
jgi:predicted DNA-binding protein